MMVMHTGLASQEDREEGKKMYRNSQIGSTTWICFNAYFDRLQVIHNHEKLTIWSSLRYMGMSNLVLGIRTQITYIRGTYSLLRPLSNNRLRQ